MRLEHGSLKKGTENRASNIIICNVTETVGGDREEKWKAETGLYMELFNKVLGVPIREEDMKRLQRLGKRTESAGGPRPVLIPFRDWILKNMIMESLSN